MPTVAREELADFVGAEVGTSSWFEVDQRRVDAFADATLDHQFIHVDPARAVAETPFGGTIAHGFLTLSLLSHFARQGAVRLKGATMSINYGFDKIRFVRPVRTGSKIRAKLKLIEAIERRTGQFLLKYAVTVEIEGEDKPALVAEWLTLQFVN